MLDGYHVITLTHRDAALELIGEAMVKTTSSHPTVADVLRHCQSVMGWSELMYLATCNRVTFVFYSPTPVLHEVKEILLQHINSDLDAQKIAEIGKKMRMLNGANAVTHLMEVAASMDSLVVGEREIVRQLREAFEQSRTWGLTGDHLRLLMRFTIETAKTISTHTGIGEKALSVAALAFGQMHKALPQPNARIVMIGAGQTNALFAKFLLKANYQNVTVFNRTLARAEQLAASWPQGKALPLDALPHYTEGFDALILCTSADEALVTPDLYTHLLQGETEKKVVVDLALPNNVARETTTSFSMQYIEIEGLKSIAEANLAHRQQERERAAQIISERILEFRELWHERQVERSLAPIADEVRAAKDRAIQEVFAKRMAMLDPAAQALVSDMMDYMEKKCVSIPIKTAKAIMLKAKNRAKEAQQVGKP
jgi:glutamyl-tRNA reductase